MFVIYYSQINEDAQLVGKVKMNAHKPLATPCTVVWTNNWFHPALSWE